MTLHLQATVLRPHSSTQAYTDRAITLLNQSGRTSKDAYSYSRKRRFCTTGSPEEEALVGRVEKRCGLGRMFVIGVKGVRKKHVNAESVEEVRAKM